MLNVYKYRNIIELEQKHQKSFKLCSTNKIALLPPILKKMGLIYYLAFPVIEDNKSSIKKIKRPIGIILINKNIKGKEKIFDLSEYEFCKNHHCFNHIYYTTETSSPLWPNRSQENEENYRVLLDNLQNIASKTSMFKKTNKDEYELFLNKLKDFVGEEYWDIYTQLQENKILPITEEIERKRKLATLENKKAEENNKQRLKVLKIQKQKDFKQRVIKKTTKFVREEIVPSLKGNGSYTKLLFFDLWGKTLRNFLKESVSERYENCFNPDLSQKALDNNINKVVEDINFEAMKNVSTACKNKVFSNISIDTLSKVLIVFLNALMIEEKHNKISQEFEDEIAESISIYNEDKDKIKNIDARKFLDKIFDNLCQDYSTSQEEKLSDIYFGYSYTFLK